MLTISAYAKINLTLDVLGRRPDGYHEIMSVLQGIDLADSLSFELDDEITLSNPRAESLGSSRNLVMKAAKLLQERAGSRKGALIGLTRGIPVAAGLGGGSSDAAATLRGLNELWELGWPIERLLQLAPMLGSDVAFFLYGGTALVKGRGDKVTPLPPFPKSWLVLLKPPVDVFNKTERLYASLDETHFTQGQSTLGLVNSLRQGRPASPSFLFNTFEAIAYDFFPLLREYRQRFLAAGASTVHLCGAGPTLFALVPDRPRGEELYHRLLAQGLETYLVQTVD